MATEPVFPTGALTAITHHFRRKGYRAIYTYQWLSLAALAILFCLLCGRLQNIATTLQRAEMQQIGVVTPFAAAIFMGVSAIVLLFLVFVLSNSIDMYATEYGQRMSRVVHEKNKYLQLYEEIVDLMPIGILVARLEDPNDLGSFRYVRKNAAADRASGIPLDSFIGMTMAEAFPDALNTDAPHLMLKAIQSGEVQLMPRLVYGDGNIIDSIFDMSFVPLPDNKVACIYQNITEHELTKDALMHKTEELQQRNLFLDTVLEHIPHMVFVKEARNLSFVRLNKAGEELLGLKQRDLIGKNDYDFFPKQEANDFVAYDREVLSGDTIVDIPEEPISTPLGQRVLHTKKIPLKNQQGMNEYLLGISEDITEQCMQRKMLEERTVQLERSNADLAQFAHVASHDLQEPIRMVSSFSKLLRKRYNDTLDDTGQRYLGYVLEGSTRMQQLVDAILAYAKLDGEQDWELEEVESNASLNEALQNLERLISEKQACIEYQGLPFVHAEEISLTRVFQNLIGNALKFNNAATPKVMVSADMQPDGCWRFSVQDNGPGIAPEHHEHIFAIFERLHMQDEVPGTGVGLAVTKKMIQRMGGCIWVESDLGEGAIFYFTLSGVDEEKKSAA